MIRFAACLAAALAVAACTSTHVSPVEVTRFVGDSPARLGSGTIAVRAAPGRTGDSLEFAAYQQAVAAELERLGYRVVPAEAAQSQVPGTSAGQVAELRVNRTIERPGGERSPVNVGVGAATGSYGSGVGLGVGIDLGAARPRDVVDTEMGLIIRDNATGAALWEGRARFSASADSDLADLQASAARLARALFSAFPGESGETIEVE